MTELYTAALSDWKIDDFYGSYRLIGTIASEDNKGRFNVGDRVCMTMIETINFKTGMARTNSGSIYKLI